MLSDLDGLMASAGFDALLVFGDSTYSSPELSYLVRAVVPRGGVYVKKRGADPLLVVSSLDVSLAKKGVVTTVKSYNDYGLRSLQKRFAPGRAWAEMVAAILRNEGVVGTVGIAGRMDALTSTFLADFLRRRGFRVRGMARPTLIDICRRRKDEWELEAIRSAGRKTVEVVARFEKVLEEADVRRGIVYYDGKELRTSELRKMVMIWSAEAGLTIPEGFILAVGSDSSNPHANTVVDGAIEEGEPILLDVFPQDTTGYRYDFTRTYCVGRPKPRLRKMFEDTIEAQQRALEEIREGIECQQPFIRASLSLKRRGWPTLLDRNAGQRGFIHGLGHGVGLTIGEEPYLTLNSRDRMQVGDVVTVEPGVYEPGIGGVRIEDVVAVEKGHAIILADHRRVLEF